MPAGRAEIGWLPGRRSAVLCRQGGGEKVGDELGDARSLVVVNPVRGVGQALDAVEVGHVVVIGFGEFRPDVFIALPQMTRVDAEIG